MKNTNIVVNWHLLEPCQLKCKYCYAEWRKEKLPLIFKNTDKSEKLMTQIALLNKVYKNVRLSFAGGEPLLDKNLGEKIDYAYKNNLAISIITNADLLNEDFLYNNVLKIDILGISIDSVDFSTNLNIGRATLLGKVPDYKYIVELINLAKKINPTIEIKINTVVNQFNFNEDMSSVMQSIQHNKWKIMRVLPVTKKSTAQKISDAQFEVFVNRHKHFKCVLVEDNHTMLNSYLMIDPYGRFFYNIEGGDYGYSQPISEVGIEAALSATDFNYQKFTERYPTK